MDRVVKVKKYLKKKRGVWTYFFNWE
jgi:hypothetical protein